MTLWGEKREKDAAAHRADCSGNEIMLFNSKGYVTGITTVTAYARSLVSPIGFSGEAHATL